MDNNDTSVDATVESVQERTISPEQFIAEMKEKAAAASQESNSHTTINISITNNVRTDSSSRKSRRIEESREILIPQSVQQAPDTVPPLCADPDWENNADQQAEKAGVKDFWSTISLVLATVSCLTCLVSPVNILALVTGTLAIASGFWTRNISHNGKAIWGMILGVIGTLAALMSLLISCGAAGAIS